MSVDFGSLAIVTLLTTPLNVLFHTVSHKMGSYGSLCGPDSCVCEPMNGIEDVTCPLPMNHRSRDASGSVTEHLPFAIWDVFEIETCDSRFVGSDLLRVDLSSCQLLQIDS